jgi:hypothetical protein
MRRLSQCRGHRVNQGWLPTPRKPHSPPKSGCRSIDECLGSGGLNSFFAIAIRPGVSELSCGSTSLHSYTLVSTLPPSEGLFGASSCLVLIHLTYSSSEAPQPWLPISRLLFSLDISLCLYHFVISFAHHVLSNSHDGSPTPPSIDDRDCHL